MWQLKKFYIYVTMAKMLHRDRHVPNAVGKNVLINFLEAGLPQIFNLWEMQHLGSTMKWAVTVTHNSIGIGPIRTAIT